jgi:hypothetical protein
MGAIVLVFGVVAVLSCITVLSRQNIKRFLRRRKTFNILVMMRQASE